MREDWLLARRLRRGDKAALARVYQKYKDDMLTIANCLLLDLAAAEDCLHDVFVSFAAGAAQLRLGGNLKGYLMTSVANKARDRLRMKTRQKENVSLADIADVAGNSAQPTEALADCEQMGSLYAALAQLPYAQREVISLHVHGKLRFREIAKRQGVSTNTVQSRYRYGLEKLRTLLQTGARL